MFGCFRFGVAGVAFGFAGWFEGCDFWACGVFVDFLGLWVWAGCEVGFW